jgi:hypothetical protein
MMPFTSINIWDFLEDVGAEPLEALLRGFSCPLNSEIENFLRCKAVDFALKKISMTYLVFNEDNDLVGYYALTHKSVSIPKLNLSKTSQRKIERFSSLDVDANAYQASAFLIAQLGKNAGIKNAKSIKGYELLQCSFDVLKKVQHLIGGGIVFLECEDKPKLIDFYQQNQFRQYNKRIAADGVSYHQLLSIL